MIHPLSYLPRLSSAQSFFRFTVAACFGPLSGSLLALRIECIRSLILHLIQRPLPNCMGSVVPSASCNGHFLVEYSPFLFPIDLLAPSASRSHPFPVGLPRISFPLAELLFFCIRIALSPVARPTAPSQTDMHRDGFVFRKTWPAASVRIIRVAWASLMWFPRSSRHSHGANCHASWETYTFIPKT